MCFQTSCVSFVFRPPAVCLSPGLLRSSCSQTPCVKCHVFTACGIRVSGRRVVHVYPVVYLSPDVLWFNSQRVSGRPVVHVYPSVPRYICLQTSCGIFVLRRPAAYVSPVLCYDIPHDVLWYMCPRCPVAYLFQTSCGIFKRRTPFRRPPEEGRIEEECSQNTIFKLWA